MRVIESVILSGADQHSFRLQPAKQRIAGRSSGTVMPGYQIIQLWNIRIKQQHKLCADRPIACNQYITVSALKQDTQALFIAVCAAIGAKYCNFGAAPCYKKILRNRDCIFTLAG